MKLLSVLGVFVLITTGTWAYPRNCAKGPEYWCRDASTAEACGAVRHCEQTVWRENRNNKQSMTISETAEMLCNVLVQASNKLLREKVIKVDSIKEYIRKDCTKIPNENNLIQHCESAVDIYLSDILRHIQSGTELTKICPIIQGHDVSSAFVPKPKINDLTSNATCVLCEFVIHLVEAEASANASEQELIKVFEQVCTRMPTTIRTECKNFVDQYAADLIALLVREVDPAKACELIKICPKPKNVAFLTKPNLQTCGLCDYISTYIKAGYPIENVCSHFSTENNIRQQCEILVHLYKPNICPELPLCFDDTTSEQPIKPNANPIECSLCKFVVNYVDTVVQNNRSEAAIEAALEKVCTILPHALNASCVKFVDDFGPILVQLLEKYVTPDQVCAAIKACTNATQEITHLQNFQSTEPKIVTPNSLQCTLCEFVINYINKQVGNNRSAAAFEAALEKVCNILPSSVRPNCTSFVDKYGIIIAFLLAKNSTAEQVCDFIKVCNNGTQEIAPAQPLPTTESETITPNSLECTLCEFVINYINKAIGNNRSAAAIEAALEKVCKILPSSVRPNCISFVDKYGVIIAFLLAKNSTAEQVCDFIKVCNNGTQEIAPAQPLPTTESETITPNSLECTLCEFVINYINKAIGNNRSAAAIEAALEKVCKILPSSVRPNCISFVDKYGVIIAFLLAKNSTAEQVCDFIKVCNNGTQEIAPAQPLPTTESETITPNALECTLCEFVINYINKAIGDNRSAAAIEAQLEKVCNILPSSVRPNCTSFVDKYGVIIAFLLARNSSAEQVCDFIKVCKNGTEQVAPKDIDYGLKVVELDASVECSVCKYVVSYVAHVIEDNKTEAAIESALEKVCTILPHALNASCVQFVVTFGPSLVKLIEKYNDSVKVCDALKLCNNGTQTIAAAQPLPRTESETITPNALECTLCEFVINYINKAIGDNRSAAAIEAQLEKVCNILPSSVRPNCTSFVDKYGVIIAFLLARNSTAEQVCDFIKVCKNGTEQVAPKDIDYGLKVVELDASVECSVCKYVVSYVAHVIEDNKTEAAIESALEKVCTILPHALNASCVQFVVTFGPSLVKLIEKYNDSVKVCDALKLCNNGTQAIAFAQTLPTKESETTAPNALECTLCEFVINYINKAIGDNRSAAAIEAQLEKVCNILPSSVRPNCTSFVDKYGVIIAFLLARNSTAEQVCDFIKVCKNGTEQVAAKDIDYGLKVVELDASVECSVCKYVVSYVAHVIEDNKTEAAIESALEKVCTILPHALNASCVQFVITFGPSLVKLIEKYNDSVKVCDALKLCNNGTQTIAAARSIPRTESETITPNALECTLCEFVINYINKAIGDNRSVAAIEAQLEKVCNILPSSVRPNCTAFVDKYGVIIAFLLAKNSTAEQVCDFIKVCKNGTEQVAPKDIDYGLKVVELHASAQCSVCKYVVSYVAHVIEDNKTEAAIESALEKVCTILPHALNASCVQFVVTFGPSLVTLIEKYDDPVKVCDALKLCNNGTAQITQDLAEKSKIKQQSVNSPQCSLCKLVVTYLELIVENNKTEAAIESALEKVCSILPKDKKTECIQFVDTYGTKLVELLEKLGSPKLVCLALGLCVTNTPKMAPVESVGSTQCTLCKYIIAYVDAVIQTNKSEAAIDSALEKVCTILPHSLNHSCIEFIDSYGPVLVEYIAKYATPAEVCDALKVCKNGTAVAKRVPQIPIKSVKDTVECTVCKYVISFINVLIQSNATEQEIEKGLEVVCKLLPASYHTKCDNFVETYGPILPELVAELDDPNVICDWLTLCKKSDDKFIEIPSVKSDKLKSIPCNLCQYLVNYLDAIIQSNSTETKFEQELEKACKILPTKILESECKSIVDLYGIDLIKLLVEKGNPKTVCQELGICDK